MNDTEWIVAKEYITAMFGKGIVMTADNKEAFPRLPLYGFFDFKSLVFNSQGVNFQFVGVHLKSQMSDRTPQRRLAAEKLAYWLEKEASNKDADTVIMADQNTNIHLSSSLKKISHFPMQTKK
jgi:hypothetical protein